MRYRLLEVLKCPRCGTPFHIFPLEIISLAPNPTIKDGCPVCTEGCPRGQVERECWYDCKECFSKDIYAGIIRCHQNHLFPIIKGIPRLLPNAASEALPWLKRFLTKLPEDVRTLLLNQPKTRDKDFEKYFKHTQKSYSSEWSVVRASDRAWGLDVNARRKLLLDCLDIQIDDLGGKKILDAGCGHGEVELALLKTGAEVFAIDLSFSVDAVQDRLQRTEIGCASSFHIAQANIHTLPFKQGVFDIVHSAGVLHSTPDTLRGFEILSSCLKKGGIGYIEVYTAERKDPIAHAISNILRIVTIRLPHPILHAFCFAGAPFLWIYTRSYNALTGKKLYRERSIREMELSLFDNFSPRYQYHHTTEQLKDWFTSLGYINVKETFQTKNVVGVVATLQSGPKPARVKKV